MKQKLTDLYAKNGTKKVLASLLSILAGLLLGSIVVIIVGLAEQKITTAGMWEGVRLIFAGILSTGRDAAGALTWGFNAQNVGNMLFRAMPLIMTGLSVAVAFKTGLFNIGASFSARYASTALPRSSPRSTNSISPSHGRPMICA